MALFGFEKDTLLDLTVNVIPLGILLFFVGVFAVVPAFGTDPVFTGLQFTLMLSTFFLLAVLTYYAGRAIENAEKQERNAQQASATNEPEGEVTGLDDTGVEDERALEDGKSDDN
ncbi:DUF6684 family protein [Haloarcula amylovorans]|uniref:DUF6684 family protein n=1 Tax=Haloarcula amylovorans TaxID=2562280 RepID=UPI0010764E9A|nr:DUF6684 family protein [Halomicroarcula amylolytica]